MSRPMYVSILAKYFWLYPLATKIPKYKITQLPKKFRLATIRNQTFPALTFTLMLHGNLVFAE